MCDQMRMAPMPELDIDEFDNVDLIESYDDISHLPLQPYTQSAKKLTSKESSNMA